MTLTEQQHLDGEDQGKNRLDLHSYAGKAFLASIVGFVCEGFDLQILVFALIPLSRDLHLSPAAAGSLATWTLIGAALGGSVLGIVSDYLGRVRILAWSILLFAVFTGVCAIARDYWELAAARFITGIGLGGEIGIGMTLIAEAWPARFRARGTSYVSIAWQAGVLISTLSAGMLIPVIGWRGMFAVGILPAIIAFLIRRLIDEPPIFLGKKSLRRRFPIAMLFKDRATTKISCGMIFLCAVQNFGYYGVMIWLPFYLSRRFGFSLTRSSFWTAVTILGMMGGMFIFGQIADRIGRRPAFFTFQGCAAISVFIYSQLSTPLELLIGGAVMGIFVNGMLGGYGALLAELYPTEARATAQNVLYNAGRAIGSFGPIIMGAVVTAYSFTAGTVLLALLYILDLVVTASLIPDRTGQSLE